MTSTAATVVIVQLFYVLQALKIPSCKRITWWQRKREGLAFLTDTFPSGSACTSKSDADQHIDQDFGDIIGSPKAEETIVPIPHEDTQSRTSVRCWKDHFVLSSEEMISCVFQGVISALPILVTQSLAWSVSEVYLGLGVDRVFVEWVLDEGIAPQALPVVALLASFLLSVVLGSSWITVSIMIPAISQSLLELMVMEESVYGILLGSILSGAVAGDHIGPFSETTILAGLTTGCGVRNHFLTQVLYTLPIFLLSILAGTLPISYESFPEFFGFFIGYK